MGLGDLSGITDYISVDPINGFISASTKAVEKPDIVPELLWDNSHLYSVVVNTWVGDDPAIAGTKTWEDDENAWNTRPRSVLLHIYDGATELGTVTCDATTSWTWVFSGYTDPVTGETAHLDETKIAAGAYTVREDPVPGYETTYDGLDITNTLATLTVEDTVYNSGEGNDPASRYCLTLDDPEIQTLEVQATRRGNSKPVTETLQISEDGSFCFSLKHGERLVFHDLKGVEQVSVTQDALNGYQTDVAVDNDGIQRSVTSATVSLDGGKRVTFINSKPIIIKGIKTVDHGSTTEKEAGLFSFALEAEHAQSGKFTATNDAQGIFSLRFLPEDWTDLPSEVTVRETDAPEYYSMDRDVHTVQLSAEEDINGILQVTASPLTIDNQLKTVTVTVLKQWRSITERGEWPVPDQLQVTLALNDGEQTWDLTLTEDGSWEQTVDVGDVVRQKTCAWSVTEEKLSNWEQLEVNTYTEEDETSIHYTLQLTNVYSEDYATTISGRKIWQKPESAPLPEQVTVTLSRSGYWSGTAEANADNGWTYTFRNILARDPNTHKAYTYEVTEPETIELDGGRYVQVSALPNKDGGMDLVNRWQEDVTLTLTKVWEDDADAAGLRPESVTLHLTGGEVDRSVTLTAADGWTTEVSGLPRWQYDAEGVAHEIEYAVTEEAVPGYREAVVTWSPDSGSTEEGRRTCTVTNTVQSIETVDVSGKKLWQKPDSAPLPSSVTVTLQIQKNGVTIKGGERVTAALAENGWTYTFHDVPVCDPLTGESYTYVLTEQMGEVSGGRYIQASAVANSTHGVDLTNCWQENKSVTIRKEWSDQEDSGGIRPDRVTVRVSGGTIGETVRLTAEEGWQLEVTDLPRWEYDADGNASEIRYTVTEDAVPGYEMPVITLEDTEDTCIITNTLKQSRETVSGKVLWQKPDSAPLPSIGVTITLRVQKGSETIEDGTLTALAMAENGWTYTFTDVPTRDDAGHAYTYDITESIPEVSSGSGGSYT